MLQKEELDQLDKGWATIMIIWLALLGSLGVYLVVCMGIGDQLTISMAGSQVEVFKYALFGIAVMTLFGAYFLRKFLLKNIAGMPGTGRQTASHPAIGKYTVVIVIVMALLESIGIYGVVLFLVSKDAVSLYQLVVLSATGMLYFRPKKAELIDLAEKMKSADSA